MSIVKKKWLYPVGYSHFSDKYSICPVYESVHNTGTHAIHNKRAGDGEHLRAGAQDKSLCWCQVRTHIFVFC